MLTDSQQLLKLLRGDKRKPRQTALEEEEEEQEELGSQALSVLQFCLLECGTLSETHPDQPLLKTTLAAAAGGFLPQGWAGERRESLARPQPGLSADSAWPWAGCQG